MVVLIPLLMLSGVAPAFAGGSATLRNIPPTRHFAPAGTPLTDLAAAIRLAATGDGWRVTAEYPGVTQATLRVRIHEAVVAIGFDETYFWIDYQDSINLDYALSDLKKTRTRRGIKGPRIHRNYNIWIDQLAKRIMIKAKIPPKSNLTDTAPSRSPVLVADELEKLDALRERGILSQEEFDQQKIKLLAR